MDERLYSLVDGVGESNARSSQRSGSGLRNPIVDDVPCHSGQSRVEALVTVG